MFDRIIMAQTESDVFWIATSTNNNTTTTGKVGVDDLKENVYISGRETYFADGGFLTKINKFGVQQGVFRFGGSGEPYTFRGCDIRGSEVCHVTGWNDNYLVTPLAGRNFSNGTSYRNHFWFYNIQPVILGFGIYASNSIVYLCGQYLEFADGAPTGVSRGWVAKTDSASLAWSTLWQSNYQGAFNDIAIMPNGNVVTVGNTWTSEGIATVVIFNASGTVQYKKLLEYIANATCVAVNSDNTIIVGGFAEGRSYIAKINSDLTSIIWQRQYTGGEVQSIAIDSGGNVVAIASISNDALIYKFDPSGTLLWQRRLGTSGADAGYGIGIGAGNCIYAKIQAGSKVALAKLPGDGSLTGTYGSYTYSAGTASEVLRTRGLGTTTFVKDSNISEYPYTRGSWATSNNAYSGIPIQ